MMTVNESRKLREKKVLDILSNKSGLVEFRSYHGNTTHQRKVKPMIDKATGWYKGVERLSEEQKKSTSNPFVDPEDENNLLSSVRLKHKDTYDLSVEKDRLILSWLLRCERTVALDRVSGINDPKITFYVHNHLIEVSTRTNNFLIKDKAAQTLMNLSSDDLYKVCRLLNYSISNSEPNEVRLFIREQFEDPKKGAKNADKFLKVLEDREADVKDFILRAVKMGIIVTKNFGHSEVHYYYGGDPDKVQNTVFLGNNLTRTIAFFRETGARNRHVLLDIESEMGQPIPGNKLAREPKVEEESQEVTTPDSPARTTRRKTTK